MREIKVTKRKKRKNYIITFIVLAFAIYVAALIVDQQSQISRKQSELQELQTKIAVQEAKNGELKEVVDSTEIIKVQVPVINDDDENNDNNSSSTDDNNSVDNLDNNDVVMEEQTIYKYNSAYIEQIAREELGYMKPGERVFVTVAGD